MCVGGGWTPGRHQLRYVLRVVCSLVVVVPEVLRVAKVGGTGACYPTGGGGGIKVRLRVGSLTECSVPVTPSDIVIHIYRLGSMEY